MAFFVFLGALFGGLPMGCIGVLKLLGLGAIIGSVLSFINFLLTLLVLLWLFMVPLFQTKLGKTAFGYSV